MTSLKACRVSASVRKIEAEVGLRKPVTSLRGVAYSAVVFLPDGIGSKADHTGILLAGSFEPEPKGECGILDILAQVFRLGT
jgi:hypothetical protein